MTILYILVCLVLIVAIYWLDGRMEGVQFCGTPIYMLMLKLLIPTAVESVQFVLSVIVSNYC